MKLVEVLNYVFKKFSVLGGSSEKLNKPKIEEHPNKGFIGQRTGAIKIYATPGGPVKIRTYGTLSSAEGGVIPKCVLPQQKVAKRSALAGSLSPILDVNEEENQIEEDKENNVPNIKRPQDTSKTSSVEKIRPQTVYKAASNIQEELDQFKFKRSVRNETPPEKPYRKSLSHLAYPSPPMELLKEGKKVIPEVFPIPQAKPRRSLLFKQAQNIEITVTYPNQPPKTIKPKPKPRKLIPEIAQKIEKERAEDEVYANSPQNIQPRVKRLYMNKQLEINLAEKIDVDNVLGGSEE